MKKTISTLLFFGLSLSALACPVSPLQLEQQLKTAKSQKINIDMIGEDNLTEDQFNSVVAMIKDHFTPIFLAQGKTLNVNSSWTVPINNALATQDHRGSNVYFFGLFTKNKFMTKDAFLFVGCHEIGHHLGGFPKNSGSISWASVEGESDYFAAAKCLREILKNDPENSFAESLNVPESVKEMCKAQYAAADDYRICLRASRAAEDVGKLLDYMGTMLEKPETFLLQAEPAPAAATVTSHPKALCRTHTILQASLCHVASDVSMSDTDETIGACHGENGDSLGNRPLCWFKPRADDIIVTR
jgi:hypothetical protein